MRSVPLPDDLDKLPAIVCHPVQRGKFSEYLSEEEVNAIRAYDLDFILRFGFNIIRGDVLQSARYGVWSFHHGDESAYRGGPPGFWEIYEGNPISGAVLQRLTGRLDAGHILRRGFLRTLNYSYSRNLNRLLMESTHWPASVAREIVAGGSIDDVAVSTSTAPIYMAPSNIAMIRYFGILARNIVIRLCERFFRDEWNVGIVPVSIDTIVGGAQLRDVRWYPAFKGGWLADPMAQSVNGSVQVLCERMSLDTQKAHIAAMSFNGKGWSDVRTAIDTGCHASYPYIFHFQGNAYCVPETFEANEVRLYRCVSFPDQWQLERTLLSDISTVDNTIFEYEGRWWLLCTTADATGHRLNAYYADVPFGPWRAHPRNPVKVDVRSARPAGAPFWYGGNLYRPAQDCSKTYGGRITINRIVQLSPTAFSEETVSHVEPDPAEPYGRALHTLSFAGDYCVIDGKRSRFKYTS